MQVIVSREIPADDSLRHAWDQLVPEQDGPEVFYTYEWAAAVALAFGYACSPLLMLGYENGILVGVASLSTNDSQGSASFLSASTADYCDFVSSPANRRRWIEIVFNELRKLKIGRVVLANLPDDSASSAAISELAPACGFRVFSRSAYACSRVRLGDSSNREQLKKDVLGKQMYRRKMNAMGRVAPVSVRHNQSWSDIEGVLPAFVRAQVARSFAVGRISHLVSAERREFLRQLAEALSRRGWLNISELLIGDRPVAWNYGFRFQKSWFWYQPTFSTEHDQFSPGFCLLTKIVAEACDAADLEVVDMGLGGESYKDRFATDARCTSYVTLSKGIVSHGREIARYRIAEWIKSKPATERRIRGFVSLGSGLARQFRKLGALGLVGYLARRISSRLFGRDEVRFYEMPANAREMATGGTQLVPLRLEQMADLAIRYCDDQETLSYILRSANRLKTGRGEAFALTSHNQVPVSFSWVDALEGFRMAELDHMPDSPSPASVAIFDCWTPKAHRGQGYFAASIGQLARRLQSAGKEPWIFAAASNRASIRGIEKARFQYRWSLRRQRIFGLNSKVTKDLR